MSMTVQDIIDDARQNLSDDSETAWTDAVLVEHVRKAVTDVVTLRPDLLLVDGGTLLEAATVQDLDAEDDEVLISDAFQGPLMLLACYWALMRDSDDRANMGRAKQYRADALRQLGVGG